MKKFWIRAAIFASVVFALFLLTMEVQWRFPSGPQGMVHVHYTIPVIMKDGQEGVNGFGFWIAGHVERVQIIPTSGHNEHGFVMLYIKTSEGWYETPTASLGGPIDWKRGVKVEFHYPDGMVLRAKTRSPISLYSPITKWLRLRGGGGFGFGDYLDDGDIASIHFRNADGAEVTVYRTNGLLHQGYAGGYQGLAVEVNVFEE